ncbi:CPBP family intramembrane metalloprotease [Synechococcales cyanobacterium C]|uniref:CPBP family intramembrane metalloprotease n=1 Tax=Petrachloros mirabilis ULC683 TaxID=2781853 RepID=A0A8K1ZYM5_9CYAN|nr:type II CAAX endopeptidase family protein [Petrachloros mirabilis]NCJ06552.1 CPBP family intramembrane metalloprotease [Petrachloros mirabilis ULC683]
MTLKRLILGILTVWVVIVMTSTLLASWNKPQTQSQLSLYQTDLLLYAAEWQGDGVGDDPNPWRQALIDGDPFDNAIQNYRQVRKAAQRDWERQQDAVSSVPQSSGSDLAGMPSPLVNELDLRLGLLYAANQQPSQALQTWNQVIPSLATETENQSEVTARVLVGLWSDPPRLLPDAQQQLQTHLSGWFRYRALQQLYDLQQRQSEWVRLHATEQIRARQAFIRLLLVSALNVVGLGVGIVLLVIGIGRFFWQRYRRASDEDVLRLSDAAKGQESGGLSRAVQPVLGIETSSLVNSVLWPPETIWQVMVLWFTGFFGVSFLGVPLVIQGLGLNPRTFDAQMQAYTALWSYLTLMGVGFAILYLVLRAFVAQPLGWLPFRVSVKSVLWGLGSYWVALPLVTLVSLLNQRLLQNQGGGNPLLEIILQNQGGLTIGVLFLMVAGLAPFFEEILFRGFLLTSLTRYLPVWKAVGVSAVMFAIAHLNLSDVLPLTVLGIILGLVYLRSRSLIAVIILHSLWNAGSFVGLLLLGGALH